MIQTVVWWVAGTQKNKTEKQDRETGEGEEKERPTTQRANTMKKQKIMLDK